MQGLIGRRVGEEADGKAVGGGGDWTGGDFLVGKAKFDLEALDQMVHENQNLEAGVLFAGAHPRPSAERDVRERRRPFPLESRRIELVRIREVFCVLVGRRRTPVQL